jgi:hypothetical protein
LFCAWSRWTVEKAKIPAKIKHANTTLVSDLIFSPYLDMANRICSRSFS